MDDQDLPILTAVSNSARQLYLLLRCIAFSTKAHVLISEEGFKCSVDEAGVMEASAFVDKSLFTAYNFNVLARRRSSQQIEDSDEEDGESDISIPIFQISLPALLETLQIFGLTDPNHSKPPWARDQFLTSTAFSNNVLGLNNICRISYAGKGEPLSIILTEASVHTQCDLTTYEPSHVDEIPFDRNSLVFKTIMRGSWLHDAISELFSTSPENLSMYAKMVAGKPFFALSSSGTLGSARVEFNNNQQLQPPTHNALDSADLTAIHVTEQSFSHLLEIFQLSDPDQVLKSTYKFSLIQRAARAMSVATKVSIRVDTQGVLSLQFMIKVEGGSASGVENDDDGGGGGGGGGLGKVSFVDFRFIPLTEEEDDDDEGEDESANETMMQTGGGSDVGSMIYDEGTNVLG